MTSTTSVWDMPLGDFRHAIESRSMPGCGAAAAASAGLGLALVLKGLRISDAKRHDARRDALIRRADALLETLGECADEDVRAFEAYLAATRQRKTTAQAAARREQAIEAAAERASRVPLNAAASCLEALELAAAALVLTQANLRSDTLAGGRLLHGGLSAVLLSVDANLASLRDDEVREQAAQRRHALQGEADRWLSRLGQHAGAASDSTE